MGTNVPSIRVRVARSCSEIHGRLRSDIAVLPNKALHPAAGGPVAEQPRVIAGR